MATDRALRPGPGRPPKPAAEREDEVISAHMTKELADKVYRVAHHAELSASAIIRTALRRFFQSTEKG